MGGYNSGNHGGRPTVEASLALNLPKLLGDRRNRPQGSWQGSWVWTNSDTGEQTASIRYEAKLEGTHGRIRLLYTSTDYWTGEKRVQDYWVHLENTLQPFGGRRWWFVCPKRGHRVAKLYLPTGSHTFASRRAYRLGYRSQRESPSDRALSQAFKLRRRLGSEEGIGDYILKPKGMHQTTFERAMVRVEAAEYVVDAHTVLLFNRFTQHSAKSLLTK